MPAMSSALPPARPAGAPAPKTAPPATRANHCSLMRPSFPRITTRSIQIPGVGLEPAPHVPGPPFGGVFVAVGGEDRGIPLVLDDAPFALTRADLHLQGAVHPQIHV